MSNVPQRSSLTDQTVAILREGMAAGRWSDELPSEAQLCRELRISRVTLRRALEHLVRERWVRAGGKGKRHSVRRRPRPQTEQAGRIIRILTPYATAAVGAVHHALLETFAARATAAGYQLEFEHHAGLYSRHQPNELRRLDALPDTAAWILFYSTEAMQRWFAANGRPCLIVGLAYDGVELPSLYSDPKAPTRHAAGLLYSRGSREMVYLIANFTSLSDRISSEVFVEEARRLGASARIVTHRPTVTSLRSTLDKLLASRPRPTAFFSGCPEHCLTILCHLLEAGLRVPRDAYVVSGWDDMCLRYAVPSIAHYHADGAKMGNKAAEMILEVLKHGTGKVRRVRIVPEFIAGGTV